MADALMGSTETSAAAVAVVSNLVQKFLIQKSVLLPTVTDYSSLAVKGAASIKLPRSGGFTVNAKAENTSQDSQIITYAADTISLNQHRTVQFLLEDIASVQAAPDIAQDAIMKATMALALDADKQIITELKLGSASAPDHLINFIDTATDVIAKGDILNARRLLQVQNIDPRECYIGIGPEKEAEMLALADFIQAERYGSNTPVQLGEIGRVFGLKVIVHNDFSDFMCVWHPSAVGYAFQMATRFQTMYDLKELAMRYSLDYLAGFEVLDGGKRTVLVDSTN